MTEPLRVLIVEDNAVVLMQLEMLLEDAGHEVVGTAGTRTGWLAAAVGHSLADVVALPQDTFAALRNGLNVLGETDVEGVRHDVVAFRTGDHIVVELTPRIDGPTLDATFLADLEALGARCRSSRASSASSRSGRRAQTAA